MQRGIGDKRAVTGEDIRTATSLALAALSADGKTILYGYEHIRRGYEDFDKKMNSPGAMESQEIPMQQ